MILDDVEKLKAQAEALFRRYEAILPESIKTEHWIQAKHGPGAWEALAIKYPTTLGIDGVTTLGTVITWLEGLILREKAGASERQRAADGLPKHDLSLVKTRTR